MTLYIKRTLTFQNFFPPSPLMPLCNMSKSPYQDFRDATYGPVTFGLSIRDAWRGLAKAKSLGYTRALYMCIYCV